MLIRFQELVAWFVHICCLISLRINHPLKKSLCSRFLNFLLGLYLVFFSSGNKEQTELQNIFCLISLQKPEATELYIPGLTSTPWGIQSLKCTLSIELDETIF